MQWFLYLALLSSPPLKGINRFFSSPSISLFSSYSSWGGYLYGSTVEFKEFKGFNLSFTVFQRNFLKKEYRNLNRTYGYLNLNYKFDFSRGYLSLSLFYGGEINIFNRGSIFSKRFNF
jgi:hypothetical protein